MNDHVLIFSNAKDVDTDIVEKALIEHNETPLRLNTEYFSQRGFFVTLANNRENTITMENGATVELSSIKSVWYRRPIPVRFPNIQNEERRSFAEHELQELINQLYVLLPDAMWVSSPYSIKQASHKYRQLLEAQKIGFIVPKTCMTNSPEEALKFINGNETTIYKTLHSPVMLKDYSSTERAETITSVPTSVIRSHHLPNLNSLPNTGGIFQEYIEKAYELRVTVIGDNIFAAKINSQSVNEEIGRVDWRYSHTLQHAADPYTLPEDIQDKCLKLVKKYNLKFGALDFVKTPDGRYVFLEINPNGQWVWLDKLTGEPYVETMVKLLARS